MTIRTLTGPKGYSLTLDTCEIFADDPGQGTPAIVTGPCGQTGTFWCAIGEGEIEGITLPISVFNWLNSLEGEVSDFIERNLV